MSLETRLIELVQAIGLDIKSLFSNKSDVGHGHDSATGSSSGFLSATDKSKLDGISVGAQKTNEITKAEIEAVLTGEISSHSHSGGAVLNPPTISGPIAAFETNDIQLTITNYDPNQQYFISVDGGSAYSVGQSIYWKLPQTVETSTFNLQVSTAFNGVVSANTIKTITVHDLGNFNDDSIQVVDFESVESFSDGIVYTAGAVAIKDDAKFVSEQFTQEPLDDNWKSYQVDMWVDMEPANPASTPTSLKFDKTWMPVDVEIGDTIYVRETGTNDVRSIVVTEDILSEDEDLTYIPLVAGSNFSTISGTNDFGFYNDGRMLYYCSSNVFYQRTLSLPYDGTLGSQQTGSSVSINSIRGMHVVGGKTYVACGNGFYIYNGYPTVSSSNQIGFIIHNSITALIAYSVYVTSDGNAAFIFVGSGDEHYIIKYDVSGTLASENVVLVANSGSISARVLHITSLKEFGITEYNNIQKGMWFSDDGKFLYLSGLHYADSKTSPIKVYYLSKPFDLSEFKFIKDIETELSCTKFRVYGDKIFYIGSYASVNNIQKYSFSLRYKSVDISDLGFQNTPIGFSVKKRVPIISIDDSALYSRKIQFDCDIPANDIVSSTTTEFTAIVDSHFGAGLPDNIVVKNSYYPGGESVSVQSVSVVDYTTLDFSGTFSAGPSVLVSNSGTGELTGIHFSSDGLFCYCSCWTGSNLPFAATLTIPFDINGAVFSAYWTNPVDTSRFNGQMLWGSKTHPIYPNMTSSAHSVNIITFSELSAGNTYSKMTLRFSEDYEHLYVYSGVYSRLFHYRSNYSNFNDAVSKRTLVERSSYGFATPEFWFSRDGNLLITHNTSTRLVVYKLPSPWSITTREQIGTLDFPSDALVTNCFYVAPNGNYFAYDSATKRNIVQYTHSTFSGEAFHYYGRKKITVTHSPAQAPTTSAFIPAAVEKLSIATRTIDNDKLKLGYVAKPTDARALSFGLEFPKQDVAVNRVNINLNKV